MIAKDQGIKDYAVTKTQSLGITTSPGPSLCMSSEASRYHC